MFKDLVLSEEIMTDFTEKKTDAANNLNIQVLQQSVWPFVPRPTDMAIPNFVRFTHESRSNTL